MHLRSQLKMESMSSATAWEARGWDRQFAGRGRSDALLTDQAKTTMAAAASCLSCRKSHSGGNDLIYFTAQRNNG